VADARAQAELAHLRTHHRCRPVLTAETKLNTAVTCEQPSSLAGAGFTYVGDLRRGPDILSTAALQLTLRELVILKAPT
jgi:hypothetical protein